MEGKTRALFQSLEAEEKFEPSNSTVSWKGYSPQPDAPAYRTIQIPYIFRFLAWNIYIS
jgi:hypothetical protein